MNLTTEQLARVQKHHQDIVAAQKWEKIFHTLCELLDVDGHTASARYFDIPELADGVGDDHAHWMCSKIRNAHRQLRIARASTQENANHKVCSLIEKITDQIARQAQKYIWPADGSLYNFRVTVRPRKSHWHETGNEVGFAQVRGKDGKKLLVNVNLTLAYRNVDEHFAVIGSGSNRLITTDSRLIQNPILEEKNIIARKLTVFGRPSEANKKNRLKYYEEGLTEYRVNSPEYLAMMRSFQTEKQLQSLDGANGGAFTHEIYYLEHKTMKDSDGLPLCGHGHTINRAEHLLNRRIKAEALSQLGI